MSYTPGQRLRLPDGRTATVGDDGVPRFDGPAQQQSELPSFRGDAAPQRLPPPRDPAVEARAERSESRADENLRLAREAAARQAETSQRQATTLTQDQGQSGLYARMQARGERDYREAIRDGYDPTALNNGIARGIDSIPLIGGWGSILRTDVADRGVQAEGMWTEAQLRALTGAAATKDEIARNINTFFPGMGHNIDDVGPQMGRARDAASEGVTVRAGPGARGVKPALPFDLERNYQRLFDSGKIDRNAPEGYRPNPFIARTPQALQTFLAKPENIGLWVMGPDGKMQQASGPRRTQGAAPAAQRPPKPPPRTQSAPARGQRMTPEQAAKLPKGTRFVGTDGVERVRQ